jgi:hypothetical protein
VWRRLCRRNDRALYGLLFKSATTTLLRLAEDPKWLGARIAITAVLHTWTRELDYHPHLHCIVSAGGLSLDGTRIVYGSARYLFPVAVLGALFRGLFLDGLKRMIERGEVRTDGLAIASLIDQLYRTDWVVYAKRPFGGPEAVFSYLGRYTHCVGLSNQRMLSMDEQGVCFLTKGGKTVTLAPQEFIRRFLLHVLPPGFIKLRHYGLWSGGRMPEQLEKVRQLLEAQSPQPPTVEWTPESLPPDSQIIPENEGQESGNEEEEDWIARLLRLCGLDLMRCPACTEGRMICQPLPPSPPLYETPKLGVDSS